MPTEKSPEQGSEQEQVLPERDPDVPKPPTREQLRQISEEQALITDEWTGEAPSSGTAAIP